MENIRNQIKKAPVGLLSSFFLILLSTAGLQQNRPEVPYVPTPEKVVVEMLRMADVDKEDVLYDLGCGDGRIVITAAKELGCRGVGIDIDPVRIKESRENATNAGVSDRVEFFLMDLFETDISQATVVTLYLLSDVNIRLRPKLLRELESGTRVVSHDFDMKTWKPDGSTVINDNYYDYPPVYDTWFHENSWNRHNVYLWIIPANVTGTWKWTMPAISGKKRYTLELDQTFQEVNVKAFEDSSSIPVYIKDEKIRGNRLEFTLERKLKGRTEKMHFEGFVKGHTMEGHVRIEGKSDINQKWRAKRVPSTLKAIDK